MNDRAVKPVTSHLLPAILTHPLARIALIVLIGCLAYAGTFHAPFQYDDFRGMLDKPYVQDLRYLGDWSLARQFSAEHAFSARFIGYLSFALNHALHGDAVEGYHIVNLTIHLLNALLVYSFVRLTLKTPYFEVQGSAFNVQGSKPLLLTPHSSLIPLFAALLFVAHPVQTQAVTYIVQRLTSLATLFCLATVVFYIMARLALDQEGLKGKAALLYAASLCCALLAMKTKEIAFTLPLAVCIFDFMFFSGTWKKRFICLMPLLLTMLVIPLTLLMLTGTGGALGDLGSATRAGSDLTRAGYFFTELRVIVTYLRLLLLPVNQNLDYDYPVYRSLFTPPVFLSLLLLAALFALAVYLYYRSTFKVQGSTFEIPLRPIPSYPIPTPTPTPTLTLPLKGRGLNSSSPFKGEVGRGMGFSRLIAFGIFWFFLTLSVESSIIPITDVIFEHRLYLPSVGAFLAFATCFVWAGQRLAARVSGGGTAAVVLAGLIILALTAASYARNRVWQSNESLWQDVVNKSPGKAVGYQYLGIALFERGDIERAFASFDRSLALDPSLGAAYINRGTLNARVGRYQQALADLSRAVDLDPSSVEAWSNLGLTWSQSGEQDKAISCLGRAIDLNPAYLKALNNMGLALIRKGSPGEAIPWLDKALSLNRNYGLAWFNRGVAHKATGRLDRAIGDFRTACENGDENGCGELRALTGNR